MLPTETADPGIMYDFVDGSQFNISTFNDSEVKCG